jgi:hypothetical protein
MRKSVPSPLSPAAMKTYEVKTPVSSHFRAARCEEVNCDNHANGWVTVVDESTGLGQRQAAYIRQECRPTTAVLAAGAVPRARYVEGASPAGWTEFRFPAGQQCFAPHRARIHRPEVFLVREGDRRGNPRGVAPRRHDEAEHWIEDMQGHLDGIRTIAQRG